jgi:hypothetical protein
MFEYSVITPTNTNENTFFIVPLEEEERFTTAYAGAYTSARLDLMLEILNGYQTHAGRHMGTFETEHYRYSREQLEKGMLARVTARK